MCLSMKIKVSCPGKCYRIINIWKLSISKNGIEIKMVAERIRSEPQRYTLSRNSSFENVLFQIHKLELIHYGSERFNLQKFTQDTHVVGQNENGFTLQKIVIQ